MEKLTDWEIFENSDAIETVLSTMNKENRGEVGLRILLVVRNL